MRVYELAKELGLTTKELMDTMATLKVAVKSHSSTLTVAAEDRIRTHVAATRPTKGKKASAAPAPPVAAPRVIPPTAALHPDAKTATGERILGIRKIVLPPPAPEPAPELAADAATAARPEAPERLDVPGRPEGAPKPEAPPRVVSRPAATAPASAVAPAPAAPTASAASPAAPPVESPRAPSRTVPRHAPEGPPPPVRIEPVKPPRREAHRDVPREPQQRDIVPGPSVAPARPAPAGERRRQGPGDGRPAGGRPQFQPRRPMRRLPRRRRRMPVRPEPEPVEVAPAVASEIELLGPVSVGELATRLGAPPGEIVRRLLDHGVLAGMNQQIPVDLAQKVAETFGTVVQRPAAPSKAETAVTKIERMTVAAGEGAMPRPPVVTVMGHVDHGKTTLLDAIRRTKVAEQEFGGITQHIGASVVQADSRSIVFIDTPGHAAFTALRARGAQVTDIAVLVVAADDGPMPQTVEAINHARAAGVPIIVAINKIDLPQANPDRVKQALSDLGLVPEDWGGDVIMVPVSARQGTGLDHLLEMILLLADLQELKAEVERPARGTVIEARLDRGRGPVATVLIQEGRLKVGDAVVTGESHGRVRAMVDAQGKRVDQATPSTPVEVVGLVDVPVAGDLLEVVRDERLAKAIAEERRERRRAAEQAQTRPTAPEEAEGPKELRLIIKADAHGSVEALNAAIAKMTGPEVTFYVLHSGVGNVTESDVMLAAASRATIIGFNVRPDAQVRRNAEAEGVDIRLYRVIYEALDDLGALQKGMVAPKTREVVLGQAEVRKTFSVSRLGTIAGSYVTGGRIVRGAQARVIRDGAVVFEGRISSLRRFKDDVREVTDGFECGIGIERFNDIKEGDVIEAFEVQQVPA